MEVQAQYPSGAQLFVQGDRRKVPRLVGGAAAAGVFVNGSVGGPSRAGSVFWGVVSKQDALLNGAAGFSGEPESELTCIASGPRKRVCDGNVGHWFVPLGLQPEQTRVDGVPMDVGPSKMVPPCAGTPPFLQVPNGNNRLNDSEMTSTTGRPHAGALVPAATELGIPTPSEELISLIHNQNLEIDAFIRLQNERIRMEMDQTRKRQCRSILTAIRGRALHALMEKEAELESISRRNAELEEKVSQLASDNQVWIHVARSNEAAVSSLRAMLEQVLQNTTGLAEGALAPPTALQDQEEGFGETDFPAPAVMSTDAYSFCYKETLVADAKESSEELCRRSVCKVCLEREVSVLMLPCRHLCLCKQCDVAVDTCPICCSIKNASLQVFMA